jgi:hypothetical protein
VIEKALPSVGGFGFLQNYLCGLNNTCYSSTESKPDPDGKIKYAENDAGERWKAAA